MKDDKHPPEESKEPIKISLADTDKVDQENFKEAIIDAHIKADITVSDNGQALIDHLKDTTVPNPDIIFLDGKMPLEDGKETLKAIKSDNALKDIPTVIYTTSTSEKDIDDAFKAGASLYVPKPVFFRNLVRLIRKIFMMNWKVLLSRPLRKNFLMAEENISAEVPTKDEKVLDKRKDSTKLIPPITPAPKPHLNNEEVHWRNKKLMRTLRKYFHHEL